MFEEFDARRLIDDLPDAFLIVAPDGTIVAASRASSAVLGYEPQLLVGSAAAEVLPSAARPGRTGAQPLRRLATIRHRDGEAVDVEVTEVPVSGRPGFAILSVRDTSLEQGHLERLSIQSELVVAMARGAGIEATLQLAVERVEEALHADAVWLWRRVDGEALLTPAAGADHGRLALEGVSVDAIEAALGPTDDVALLDAGDHALDGFTALGYGPLLVARVGRPRLHALLVCGRRRGRRMFEPAQREVAEEFASVVLIALDLDRARLALERLAVISDLERIGRDLHDTVIQRLFASGMRLEATAQLAQPVVAERLRVVIDDLNTVAAEIRATIFGLQRDPPGVPLDEVVRQLVDDFAAPAALSTSVWIEPDLDDRLRRDVRHHMLTAVRECLANVVRHAEASKLDVTITGRHGRLTVRVVDDGIGPSELNRSGNGVRNLAARASALGGEFRLEPGAEGGTEATWTAAID